MKNLKGNETTLVHGGTVRSQFGEISEAMFLTQSYRYDSAEAALARFAGEDPDGFIYSRYGNPTVHMLEERIAQYEGAEDCYATASGMAAAFACLASLLKSGDHVVASRALFSSNLHILNNILPNWGIEVSLIDGNDIEAWRAAVRTNTKVFFAEAMSNPRLELLDVRAIAEISRAHDIMFIVDNVFVTPVLQNTLALGADVVFYSATKHIDGQGRVLGGLILGRKDYIRGALETFNRHTGPTMSAFNAWVLLKALETLEIRVERQSQNAMKVAEFLSRRPEIDEVIYPGLPNYSQRDLAATQLASGGTMVTFSVKGGREAAFKLLGGLKVMSISNNLGDAKTLITHPATTTHFKLSDDEKATLGIGEGLLRLSVGLESADDLVADIKQALANIA